VTLSVLAVDDSRTIRDMVRLTLDGAGHRTIVAEDGEHALRILDDGLPDGLPRPDLVITDINMPRLDGIGLIRALRQRPATRLVPILVLSTESAQTLKAQARDAGATGWIVKPFDPDRLLQALDRVAG
jgi:two-component system chemotaxis response regulator CheY